MGAKAIQLSSDNITFATLPGSTGETKQENDKVADTIFGYTFASEEVGLTKWNVAGNAIYKGYVGYKAKIKKCSASSTTVTGNAMSLISGKRYKSTDATKNLWDRTATTVVKDNAVAVSAANIKYIDYLWGQVEFVAGYTVVGPVTVDTKYFTTTQLAAAKSYSLTMTAEAIDTSDFDTVQGNSQFRTFTPGLRKVDLSLTGIYTDSLGLRDLVWARTELLIEIDPAGTGLSLCRGFFKLMEDSQSGEVGALEEAKHNFSLYVPAAFGTGIAPQYPFNWQHNAGTLIPTAIQTALDAWSNETMPYMKYHPEGIVTGKTYTTGRGVITNVSLSGSTEAMNIFAFELMGSGQATEAVN